jgi:hypothetical protein
MAGVVDWRAKLGALKILTNAEMHSDVCRTIMRDDYRDSIVGNFRKWTRSTPKTEENRQFFDAMHTYLGCSSGTGASLITCTYEEFLQFMSPTKRGMLKKDRRLGTRASFDVDLLSHRGQLGDEWVRAGVVDQRFMYVSREAVDTWNNVITCGTYDTYGHCVSALKRFLRQPAWLKHVSSADIGTLVILGAGAPEKDILVLNSLLSGKAYSSESKLRIVIFDDSFYMLADTVDKVHQRLTFLKADEFVDVVPCCADFMNLRQWADCVARIDDERITAFFILGGTIGNLHEERLIDAVRAVSEEDDLFVVGGEFVQGEPPAEFIEHLRATYDTPEARDLTLGPVATLLTEEGVAHDPSERRALVSVAIEDASGLPAGLRSTIPGTFGAIFRLERPIRGAKLILSASKRYRFDSFSDIMRRHFFSHSSTSVCADWDYYKILEFRRVETSDHGGEPTFQPLRRIEFQHVDAAWVAGKNRVQRLRLFPAGEAPPHHDETEWLQNKDDPRLATKVAHIVPTARKILRAVVGTDLDPNFSDAITLLKSLYRGPRFLPVRTVLAILRLNGGEPGLEPGPEDYRALVSAEDVSGGQLARAIRKLCKSKPRKGELKAWFLKEVGDQGPMEYQLVFEAEFTDTDSRSDALEALTTDPSTRMTRDRRETPGTAVEACFWLRRATRTRKESGRYVPGAERANIYAVGGVGLRMEFTFSAKA